MKEDTVFGLDAGNIEFSVILCWLCFRYEFREDDKLSCIMLNNFWFQRRFLWVSHQVQSSIAKSLSDQHQWRSTKSLILLFEIYSLRSFLY